MPQYLFSIREVAGRAPTPHCTQWVQVRPANSPGFRTAYETVSWLFASAHHAHGSRGPRLPRVRSAGKSAGCLFASGLSSHGGWQTFLDRNGRHPHAPALRTSSRASSETVSRVAVSRRGSAPDDRSRFHLRHGSGLAVECAAPRSESDFGDRPTSRAPSGFFLESRFFAGQRVRNIHSAHPVSRAKRTIDPASAFTDPVLLFA